jgi:GT2 family glycosyltransferase
VNGCGAVVVGMHRSGTSAVTRSINLLGIATCVDSDLVPASDANPRGHWESASLVRANDALLRLAGGAWWCPPRPAATLWSGRALRRYERVGRRVLEQGHRTRQWVWKDPRTSLTLPFWRNALAETPLVAVVVFRDPDEVAESLCRRNGFAPELSLALWERYVHHVLRGVAGLPVLTVRYADVVADATSWAVAATRFLESHGFDTSGADPDAVRSWIEPGRRRATSDRIASDGKPSRLSPQQRALAAALARLPALSDRFVPPPLPCETPTTELLFADLRARHRLAANGTARRKQRLSTSVVVVSRSEGAGLRQTVDALLATGPPDLELVVVDDASADGSADFAATEQRVQLLRSQERLGIARARNFGAAAAQGDVVVFSDAHVLPRPGWLEPLLRQLSQPGVGAAAPELSDMATGKVRVHGLAFADDALNVRWIRAAGSVAARPVPLLCGCFLALRRDVLEDAGGFDAGFTPYGAEDLELCLRLWRLGYECVVEPASKVRHRWRAAAKELNWEDFLYNILRLGQLHLAPDALAGLIECVVAQESFAEAYARVLVDDTGATRAALDARSVYDAAWVAARFEAFRDL